MKGSTSKVAALALTLASAGRGWAQPALRADVGVSSGPVRSKSEPFTFHFEFEKPKQGPAHGNGAIGANVGTGIREGKPLEMTLWGAGGAMIGIVGGPVGIAVGAVTGAVAGLLVSILATPKPDDVSK